MQTETCGLYLITPPRIEPAGFAEILTAALDGGNVAALQLRLKDCEREAILRAAEILRPIAQSRDVAFIMNDDPVLAVKAGCDGVHVGQGDASYATARETVGAGTTVGVTCHGSIDLAMEAAEAGADYVAFGAFFPSSTKDAKASAHPEILEFWNTATVVPNVAIGGITPDNCAPLVSAGADFLAAVSAVWDHPEEDGGPRAAVARFRAAIEAAEAEKNALADEG
ncbi:MAG: thiamine phosphate synthase [Pseudomonadota bacterium]|nr:thiamine phosphate synthase [Pseudomonadota bacterium]